MMTILWISFIFNIVLLGVIGYGVYLLNRAGDQINQYETFYQETIDALEKHLAYMSNLLNVNIGVSGDDGVREVYKTIRTFYEMLVGYYNAGKINGSDKQ